MLLYLFVAITVLYFILSVAPPSKTCRSISVEYYIWRLCEIGGNRKDILPKVICTLELVFWRNQKDPSNLLIHAIA